MKFPQQPPSLFPLFHDVLQRNGRTVLDATPTLPDGRYLSWNELRYREPPAGLSVEEWWCAVRFARMAKSWPVEAMTRCYGKRFSVVDLPQVQQALHDFDRANVGEKILTALGNPDAKVDYRIRQLIEEAISSSHIEGARPTTREVARQMLRENRTPASKSERMIVNNLRAMERLQQLHHDRARLGIEHFLELHRILGDGALDVEGASGVLRRPEHDVTVSDGQGQLWHMPPPAHGITERIEALLEFANGGGHGPHEFIHPIVRAIVVHFWVGYEHPFRDGNGRMARAMYYWCMLQQGYEVAEFLSISGPIDRAPHAYYMAFAHVESDSEDLTYFVLHQLDVMKKALKDLTDHLTKRAERQLQLSALVKTFDDLNHRQRALVDYAIHHPNDGVSIRGHGSSHKVTYITASKDLADLETRKLLQSRRVKKTKFYYAAPSLLKRALPIEP